MNLFFHSDIHPSQPLILPEEESAHCIKVLRMKAGDTLYLTDGKGMFYLGEIILDHPKRCTLKIIQSIADTTKRNFHLTIAIAPTKNIERFEWFLEKVTEIGCDKIMPIICKHSERTILKPERLNKVIVSAMKQCLKSEMPVLNALQDYKTFIASIKNNNSQKYIGHIPELSVSEFPPQQSNDALFQSVYTKGKDVIIAIGPEGGFTEQEVQLAIENGFTPISMGNSRLRVETAGVVACSVANSLNQ